LMFERFGKILRVSLLRTAEGKSRRGAFIEFQSPLAVRRVERANAESQRIILDQAVVIAHKALSVIRRESHPKEVFVQGIPIDATHAEIVRAFEVYGVNYVKMWRGSDNAGFVGDAFVSFNTPESAQKAYADGYLQPFHIGGKEVVVVPRGWHSDHLRPPSDQLCVRNVPFHATQLDLASMFARYGNVKAVVWTYTVAGRRKEMAFVYFESKDVTVRIMEAHGIKSFTIGNCELAISYAQRFVPSLFNRGDAWHMKFREGVRREKLASPRVL